MGIRITAKKKYFCAWKCCSCGQINVEQPSISGVGTAEITLRVNAARAEWTATENAKRELEAACAALPAKIHQEQKYELLEDCGVCAHCQQRQPWAGQSRLLQPVLIIGIILLLLTLFTVGAHKMIWLPILVFALTAVAAFIIIQLSDSANRKAAQQLTDKLCLPIVVTNGFPEGISADDPRIQAIVQRIVETR